MTVLEILNKIGTDILTGKPKNIKSYNVRTLFLELANKIKGIDNLSHNSQYLVTKGADGNFGFIGYDPHKNLIFRNPVNTFTDLTPTYPDAQAGWACIVEDEEYIYQFDGENWNNTGLKDFAAEINSLANSVVANLGFNIIGSSRVTSAQDSSIKILIEAPNTLVLFDISGGYRFIEMGEHKVVNNMVVILSSTKDEYSPVDMNTKGVGEIVYFYNINYGSLEKKYTIVGFLWSGNWQSPFNSLQILKKEGVYSYTVTEPLKIVDKTLSAMKLGYEADTIILNLSNASHAIIDSSKITISFNNSIVVVLSKSPDYYDPPRLYQNWEGVKFYLYALPGWEEVRAAEDAPIIIGTPEGGSFKSLSQGVLVEDNPLIKRGQDITDVRGIRELFIKNISKLDLRINDTWLTIQEIALDSITMGGLLPSNSLITFGSFENPFNKNKGEYRIIAQAKMVGSPDNSKFVEWAIEPLNGSGLNGYMQTKRDFFDFFYGTFDNDWKSKGDGSDSFVYLSTDKVNLVKPTSAVDNIDKENKGILPRESFGLYNKTSEILRKLKAKKANVTIVLVGDSISTNGLYASDNPRAAYAPPRMDEEYYVKLLEENLRWKGQQYRRFDAAGIFSETSSSAETKSYDDAWDWIAPNQGSNHYDLPTRVLDGNNCAVKFTIPKGTKQAAFIYRTDYLCANSTKVSITQGNNILKINGDEANGYSFNTKEIDELISTPRGSLRKSQSQKRLVFRFDDISADTEIVISNIGSGRLNYWGIEYSPYEFMFRLINTARGSHDIVRLGFFEEYDVDAVKPDAIIMQCCIINEGATSVVAPYETSTPEQFANRFLNYANHLKSKEYAPEVIPLVLYIGVQGGIVDPNTGAYQMSFMSNGEPVDVYKYIGALDNILRSAGYNILNCFRIFDEIAYRKSEIEGTNNIWLSAINASGRKGNTFTADTVHLNDYGSLIAYRTLKPFFNY